MRSRAGIEMAFMEMSKYPASSLQHPRLFNILSGNCRAKFSKSFKYFQTRPPIMRDFDSGERRARTLSGLSAACRPHVGGDSVFAAMADAIHNRDDSSRMEVARKTNSIEAFRLLTGAEIESQDVLAKSGWERPAPLHLR
jgi:hypothetical protein